MDDRELEGHFVEIKAILFEIAKKVGVKVIEEKPKDKPK